jgi:hypothetical protein
MEKLRVSQENAEKFWSWIHTRSGLALWKSIDLSNPGKSWTGPVLDPTGHPSKKPYWQSADKPARIVTDVNEVEVEHAVEVKRFHVAIRPSSNGFSFKCTDGATRRIESALTKAGDDSYYEFDYDSQEAVIFKPDRITPLAEYAKEKGWK